MASYQLLASETTIQVLSPTVTNDIVYCTVLTSPSGVVANLPVNQVFFQDNTSGQILQAYVVNIEEIMGRSDVIGATGSQTIDTSGLIADNVIFTVQYVPPDTGNTAITADATVAVGLLSSTSPEAETANMAAVNTIIDTVYANLKAAAAG